MPVTMLPLIWPWWPMGLTIVPADRLLQVGAAHLAGAEHELVLGPAEVAGGERQQLLLRLLGRLVGRDALDARRAAAGNAGVEGHAVGVPDLDLDARRVDLQLFGRDLDHRRVGAGALVEDRRADDDAAVRPQCDLGRALAAARCPVADGKAAADVGRLRLVIA